MDTIDAIKGRRAINFFDKEKTISPELLNELLGLANLSPSSFNLQPWTVIAVTDPERKKILRECAFNQERVEVAPVILIIIANPNAIEENIDSVIDNLITLGYMNTDSREKQRNAPFTLYGEIDSEKRKFFAIKNTSFFAMNLMIAARGLGLETHPMDGFNENMIIEKFNIPNGRIIPLLIAVGYPEKDLKLLPPKFRRDLNDFVKYNTY